jgi:6-phosphogluconolactonase (cycloisomerase 2 family)
MANKSEGKKPAAKNNHVVAAGVGLGAAAVAAAGAFFLYGSKNAAKNRKQVKSWALKAKADVLEKLEDAQEMTEKEYTDLIKSVSGAYAGAKNASKKDIMEFSKEMKDHWKSIEKAAAPLKKTATKEVKKVAKKVEKAAAKVATPAKKTK